MPSAVVTCRCVSFRLAPLALAPLGRFDPRSKLDIDRLPDADHEPGEPDDGQPDHEEDGAGRGIGQLAPHADELTDPAAGPRHAVEEKQDATYDAGQSEDQAGQ